MTTDTLVTLHDVPVLRCAPDGPALDGEQRALDVIGDAMGQGAGTAVVPAERLPDAFFRLASGVAGAVVQKFVTYRVRLVVLGDISRHLAGSSALRDFVHESDQGDHVWFLPDEAALTARLAERR
ncbi:MULTISPECIES: DUF4180 domain-containing protein [Streptomyces]|uniref:DUF4180 domain-containing protein n=1 Tax=Streptomyces doudnae TaxID=3075536 RepID=A0ABD5EGS9_9ACTN|nr:MULTISPECIES: DUF4180 domain-containing protein [unclassified Streptomyces]MDT0433810.1 DUF4180 domain-containing protein [Streptomyces sp. DSM 41981]MYQ62917.1 DUF4180 domain-containing protein [Streptomyces sp. SID4950]SCD46951.1 protein of unknown function [Streptomyces sp. SolWspMP-5a-2]